MTHIEIFNSMGAVDISGVTDEQIAALSTEQRTCFFAMIESARATEQGEQRHREAEQEVRRLMHAHTVALNEADAANPPASHADALRAVIAANAKR
jgi:hypothetical protein